MSVKSYIIDCCTCNDCCRSRDITGIFENIPNPTPEQLMGKNYVPSEKQRTCGTTYAYQCGCRCGLCEDANTIAQRKYRSSESGIKNALNKQLENDTCKS